MNEHLKRTTQKFSINDSDFKSKLLLWAQDAEVVQWLDSNNYTQEYSSFDGVLALEEFTAIQTDATDAFKKLQEYQSITQDYLFGYISYDVKNDTEKLSSQNFDGLHFPDLYFFQPKKLIFIRGNEATFAYLPMVDDELISDFEHINAIELPQPSASSHTLKLEVKARMSKDAYVEKVSKVLEHIYRGDIYEANICQEFYIENSAIDPLSVYHHLNTISEPPFATFLKLDHQYLLSASPERYLKKEGTKVISQPIKGTAKRLASAVDDAALATGLANDQKERSENIMIVDLVRNDLSRTAIKGSVRVEELCKVYSFKQVHQMISTVVSEVATDTSPIAIIKDTFPMGSMTGAPKISAMKIIEAVEETKRGLYSGTVGYFTPAGDFDFNVVIRSILYNAQSQYISFSVGSAITAKSTQEREYEECLLKAQAMKFVLTEAL